MKKISAKTRTLNFFRLLFRSRMAGNALYRFTKGKKAHSFWAKVPANYYQYKPGSIRHVKRHGFELELDLSDYMQWLIFFGIEAEPRETLYSLVRENMIVADIGANIGETSLEFSRRCGKGGKVFSFEPDPDTFKKLERHIQINQIGNIHPQRLGLGSHEGNFRFESTGGNLGGHHISSHGTKEIHVTTLDKWMEKEKIQALHFMKIDVEGYETHVLSGASKTIARFRPVIFAEVNDQLLKRQHSSTAQLLEHLHALHYECTHAETGKTVSSSDTHFDPHFDIIARPL